jgi:hypothetical protein
MTYNSAHDLPSFREMAQQLQGFKLLGFLLPKDKRPELAKVENQLRYIGDTVDRFCALLGPRHWVYHDSLSVDRMAHLLDSATDADGAERQLIAYYQDAKTLEFLVMRIRALPAMRRRLTLIRKAVEDYQAGRYHAVVHVLLSVMDGFVNEFESVRRGLHTREAEELDATDSIVGHHMGLTNAHKTFTRSKGATSDEPVFELYRNGIVHGTLLNYDNDVVATKAWNRLFAVADWATARLKEQEPPEPKPTWGDTFRQLAETNRLKKAMDAWTAQRFADGDDGFAEHSAVVACGQFLTYWQRKNYGGIAGCLPHRVRTTSGGGLPREIRQEYSSHVLENYTILAVDQSAPAVCEIETRLTLADAGEKLAALRWIYEGEDGKSSSPPLPGGWRLIIWESLVFLNRQPKQSAAPADDSADASRAGIGHQA